MAASAAYACDGCQVAVDVFQVAGVRPVTSRELLLNSPQLSQDLLSWGDVFDIFVDPIHADPAMIRTKRPARLTMTPPSLSHMSLAPNKLAGKIGTLSQTIRGLGIFIH